MTTLWADDLISEYNDGRQQLRQSKSKLNLDDPIDQQDATQINSMISEMGFSIDWLATGRQPGMYKGVDKRAIYQRNSFEAMDLIPDIRDELESEGPPALHLSVDDKQKLGRIFASLSHRERQCYILEKAQGMSRAQIAKELGIGKSTVQSYVERAIKKVEVRR